ncbi:hypothetical protein NT6N_12530 [Oceaniferula spumae]|uniref:VanZ-like domain-containing protein n=1 Tax=Oceaniferula spumae TaxID=2979115 RepID=A0AAT9FJS3_9BACT
MFRKVSNWGIAILIVYSLLLLAVIAAADFSFSTGLAESKASHWFHSIPAGDKLGHFLLFGGLSFIANWVLAGCVRCRRVADVRRHLLLTLVVWLLVILEECSQLYLPHRNFDRWDIVADSAGILFFAALAVGLVEYRRRRASDLLPQ